MESKTKIYALIAYQGGPYEWTSWTESVHKTREGAEKAKKEFDESHLVIGEFPMTEEQWSELKYGLMQGTNEEIFVDRGGFTAEQFKLMSEMMEKKWDRYSPCEIKEFDLQE